MKTLLSKLFKIIHTQRSIMFALFMVFLKNILISRSSPLHFAKDSERILTKKIIVEIDTSTKQQAPPTTGETMTKVAVVYYSVYGHIAIMAEEIKKGVEEAGKFVIPMFLVICTSVTTHIPTFLSCTQVPLAIFTRQKRPSPKMSSPRWAPPQKRIIPLPPRTLWRNMTA